MQNTRDYSSLEVNAALLVLEQLYRYDRQANKEYCEDQMVALAILRAINKIGKGTSWLSQLSGT